MYDAIYADTEIQKLCRKRFPSAKIEDASDFVHPERFSIELDNSQRKEFYNLAIDEGFLAASLKFGIASMNGKEDEVYKFFMELIKEKKEAKNGLAKAE